jgi:TonB family protein
MSRVRTIITLLTICVAGAFAQNGVLTTEASSTPPRAVRVSMGVMLGMVERKTLPIYPDEAMRKGIQGDVAFKVDIDETGKVVLAVPIGDGDPLLVAASVDALRSFRFHPYLLNGTPTSMEGVLAFHFSVEKTADGVNGHVECVTPTSAPTSKWDQSQFRTAVANDKGVLVVDPHKVSGPEPQLPPELAGKAGSVYLTITIGADGKVQDVKVISGDEPFIGPVVAAVKQNVYEPRLVDGKPSIVTTDASYHFGPRH